LQVSKELSFNSIWNRKENLLQDTIADIMC
jgi:hypothetical protein